jgi:hypothetical protein
MWVWNRPSNVSAFILLQPMQKTDAFAMEIAWSDDGKFPWREFVGALPDRLPRRWRGRLSRLWVQSKQEYLWSTSQSDSQADFWARLNAREPGKALDLLTSPQPPVDEAITKLDPLIQDVIDKLARYALPLFDRVEAQGT